MQRPRVPGADPHSLRVRQGTQARNSSDLPQAQSSRERSSARFHPETLLKRYSAWPSVNSGTASRSRSRHEEGSRVQPVQEMEGALPVSGAGSREHSGRGFLPQGFTGHGLLPDVLVNGLL